MIIFKEEMEPLRIPLGESKEYNFVPFETDSIREEDHRRLLRVYGSHSAKMQNRHAYGISHMLNRILIFGRDGFGMMPIFIEHHTTTREFKCKTRSRVKSKVASINNYSNVRII